MMVWTSSTSWGSSHGFVLWLFCKGFGLLSLKTLVLKVFDGCPDILIVMHNEECLLVAFCGFLFWFRWNLSLCPGEANG